MGHSMNAKLVTAYVPIPNHPRTPEVYGALGEQLGGAPVRKKCFYQNLDTLWMTKFINKLPRPPRSAEFDNAAKNTLAYHSVQHQKTSWLVQAKDEDPDADILVWVDYGVFRLPGVNNQVIYEFMDRLDDSAIHIPGCWAKPDVVETSLPCWRFCGTVLAIPRRFVDQFDYECRVAARQHEAATHTIEWEVNTWARVERKTKMPIKWYKADHDASLFTGYGATT